MTTMSTLPLTSAFHIARRSNTHSLCEDLCDSYATDENIELRIDSQRLWDNIVRTSHYGLIPGTTGMNRLALSESDRQIRNWFRKQAEEVGCRMKVDAVGNMFAILPGIDNQVPPIGIGSHFDTQPSGGRFDGILGVIGALEVLRTIKASGIKHYAPIAAINWTNEEGACFESGCTGSAVWSGHTALEKAFGLKSNSNDGTLGEQLRRIRYDGTSAADYRRNRLSAHFELHIEQGSRLENAGLRVGVVTGIQGQRRFNVTIEGEKAHAGSTAMSCRADALVAAAKAILMVEKCARDTQGVATVGVIHCEKGSANCIPGKVFFTIDLRHGSPKVMAMNEQHIRSELEKLEKQNAKLAIKCERIWELPAADFSQNAAYSCMSTAANNRFGAGGVTELVSFAGHDSAMTALRVPTAMLFAPSKGGISHAPDEYTNPEQCADGVQVLLEATLLYDRVLQRRVDSSQDMSNLN